MTPRHRSAVAACALAPLLLALAGSLRAQEIVSSAWGFDGSVRTGAFNMLTVEVRNPTGDVWEDDLQLTRSLGLSRVGLPLTQSVYLAPGQSRWVQFAPYVADESASWRLSWRAGQVQPFAVPTAAQRQDAWVLLEEEPVLRKGIKGIPRFPAARWPASATITDVVRDVVLDHVPDWDEPRRRSFLDWLARGGRLHVLRGGDDRRIFFGGALDVLDGLPDETVAGAQRMKFGAGDVFRYDQPRRDIGAGALRRLGVELNVLELREREGVDESMASWRPDVQLLGGLRSLVRANHSWGWIFFAAVVFLLIVGPLHWWLSRARRDSQGSQGGSAEAKRRWRGLGWKGSIVYLLGAVALFTWLFLVIGARGYGEQQRLQTIGVARSLGDGRWDIEQTTNLFVTTGDRYALAVPGDQAVVSAGPVREGVRGSARSGSEAGMVLDVPLFSSRPFLRRAVQELPGPQIRATMWDETQWIPDAIEVDAWPEGEIHGMWWLSGFRLGQAMLVDGRLVVQSNVRIENWVAAEQALNWSADGWSANGMPGMAPGVSIAGAEGVMSLRALAERFAPWLVGDAMRLMTKEDRERFDRESQGILVELTPQPEPAKVTGLPVQEEGYTLFIVPVQRPN